jgi:hypothetical protein
MVLKIASDDKVKLMRHEKDYVPIEAKMIKKLNEKLDIEMPKLLYFDDSRKICQIPYFFMSFIEGEPLSNVNNLTETQIGSIKIDVIMHNRGMMVVSSYCDYKGTPASEKGFQLILCSCKQL